MNDEQQYAAAFIAAFSAVFAVHFCCTDQSKAQNKVGTLSLLLVLILFSAKFLAACPGT